MEMSVSQSIILLLTLLNNYWMDCYEFRADIVVLSG